MFEDKKVSLVLPAYNEAQNIGRALREFLAINLFDEIIVVDNNSIDNTLTIASNYGVKVIKELNQGYGFALRRGISEATGDYIFLCEPDGTFSANDAKKLLSYAKNSDMVTGTRTNLNFVEKGANMGFLLRFGNIAVAKLIQYFFKTSKLTDCGCTYRVLNRSLVNKILPFLNVGWSHFLAQLVILTALSGKSILEIPISYKKRIGTSKITGSIKRAVLVGLRMVGLVVKYRLIGKAVFKKSPKGN